LGTVFVILIGKSVLAYLIGLAFRQSAATALTISASLAQIGEFSFILATLGVGLGLLPVEGRDLILAGALISILVNPLLFHLAESLRPRVEARSAARHPAIVVPERVEPELDGRAAPPPAEGAPAHPLPTSLSRHAVLVGYGRVGRVVADGLARHGKPFVLIEDSETAIAAARAAGVEVVAGNAATAEALALANIEAAETLIVAIPHVFEAGQAVEQGRRLNPGLEIVARAHTDEEIAYLNACGANQVIVGAREIGLGMLGWTTGDAAHQQAAERTQAGFEAIAAALAVDSLPAARRAPDVAPEPPLLPAAVDAFEAAIEAAHPAHVPAGPAEPPELVPALGEMPAEDEAEAESADVPLGYVSVAQLPPQAPVVEAPVHFEPPAEVSDDLASAAVEGVPAPPPSPPPPRAEGPANTPGAPFRPKPRDADGA
jgi:CPA2 family monovalent cation:H+ antiporter-2